MALLRQTDTSSAERELTRAVRRVQERYGSNLNSFFEDAKRAAVENRKLSDPLSDSSDERDDQES